jgi:hypothetical protein
MLTACCARCAAGYKAATGNDAVSSISPLAASNEEADRLQAKLVASWQRAAPHHLAWVDTAVPGNRLQEHGAQLTLVRAHSSQFAPSQVGAAAYIYMVTRLSSSSSSAAAAGLWYEQRGVALNMHVSSVLGRVGVPTLQAYVAMYGGAFRTQALHPHRCVLCGMCKRCAAMHLVRHPATVLWLLVLGDEAQRYVADCCCSRSTWSHVTVVVCPCRCPSS